MVRRHQKTIAAAVFTALLVFAWRAEAQIPRPRPSAYSTSLPQADPSWFYDPRWWAIVVTFMMSASGLISQRVSRSSDRREDLAGEQFDNEVKEAIRECYKELTPTKWITMQSLPVDRRC